MQAGWGAACKGKEGREKGRTGAGAVKREEEVGNGVWEILTPVGVTMFRPAFLTGKAHV